MLGCVQILNFLYIAIELYVMSVKRKTNNVWIWNDLLEYSFTFILRSNVGRWTVFICYVYLLMSFKVSWEIGIDIKSGINVTVWLLFFYLEIDLKWSWHQLLKDVVFIHLEVVIKTILVDKGSERELNFNLINFTNYPLNYIFL